MMPRRGLGDATELDSSWVTLGAVDLQRTNELLRAVVSQTTDLVFVKDREGRYLLVNQACARAVGREMRELIGRDDQSFFDEESAVAVLERDQRVMASGAAETHEERLVSGGRARIYLTTKAPFRNADGDIEGVIGVARDITERKEIEDRAERQRRQHVEAESLAHIGSFEWNIRTGELEWSDELLQIYGYRPGEIVPSVETFLSHIHPDDRPVTQATIERAVETCGTFRMEERIVRADGEPRVLESCGRVLADDAGRPARLVGACLDITDRRRMHAELQASESRYRTLVEMSPDGIAIVQDGRVAYVNRAALRLIGARRPEDLLGRRLGDHIHPDDLAASAVRQRTILEAGEDVPLYTLRLRRLDGAWIDVETCAGPCRHNGAPAIQIVGRDVTGRKRADDALRAGHDFQESIIRTAAEGICVCFAVAEFPFVRFSVWNDRMTELTGYTVDEINRLGWYQTVYPDEEDRRRAIERMDRMREGDDMRAEEWEITRKDGARRTVSISTSRVLAAEGRPAVVAMMQDVTERHDADRALRHSEQRYRNLVETSHDLIWSVDAEGLWTFLNRDGAQAIYDRAPEEMIGRPFREFVDPERLPRDLQVFSRLLDGEAIHDLQTRHLRKDGTSIDLSFHAIPIRDETGAIVGTTGTAQDVSARKRAEESLRRRNEGLRILSELAADLLAATDLAAAVERLFRKVSGWVDCDVFFNYAAEGEVLRLIAAGGIDDETRRAFATLEIGQALCGTTARRRQPLRVARIQDGCEPKAEALRRIGLRAYACFPLTAGERLLGTLAFASRARDEFDDQDLEFLQTISHYVATVSERLRGEAALRDAQEHLRQSQKLQAVGQLAGGLAHDLNNILTIISGYSDLLLTTLPPADAARGQIGEIREAGERAAALTRQLLAFSRRQVLAPTVVCLNDVVTGMGSMIRQLVGTGVRLQTRLAPDLRPVSADRGQLEQILMNLAVNARDAMPQGGTLSIATRNVVAWPDPPLADTSVADSSRDAILLEVSDTGLGMTSDVKARIFEPFFSTKSPGAGTGLGLATVYGIVHQSGGRIEVISAPGAGSTFQVVLPALDGSPSPASRPAAPPLTAHGGETILLVEDEDGVRRVARRQLEMQGYRVIEADCGDEALRRIDEHPRIDLLVTDLVMPGIDGRELAVRLRRLRPGMKVLFMSGFAGHLHDGFGDREPFLQKPFSAASFAAAVRNALDGEAAPPRA